MKAHPKPSVWHARNQGVEMHCVLLTDGCRDEVDLLRAAATQLRKVKRRVPDAQLSAVTFSYNEDGIIDSLNLLVDYVDFKD